MSMRICERILTRPGETRRVQVRWDTPSDAPVLGITDNWCDGTDARTLLGADVRARPEHVATLANGLIEEAVREGWVPRDDRAISAEEIRALADEPAGPYPTPLSDALFP